MSDQHEDSTNSPEGYFEDAIVLSHGVKCLTCGAGLSEDDWTSRWEIFCAALESMGQPNSFADPQWIASQLSWKVGDLARTHFAMNAAVCSCAPSRRRLAK